jgi:glycosyltransferase involved in cell wall biosynthesis/SAM-dependent methyltransferase
LTSTGAMPTAMREAERATATRTRRRAGDVATIGLCMIVKNESKVIGRCLTSMLPLVDYILVVDTGSEDGTQQIIRDFLAEHDIAGAVIEEPWQNFAYNRTFALERLREVERIDYAFMIDADDTVVLDDGFDPRVFKSQLDHDLYDVQVLYADIAYARPQICSNRLPFSYKGVLHEYLEAPPCDLSRADASGFRIKITGGGARSNNPRKFQDDAALLERTLQTETDPFLISRYTFYLAQSYKDCGEKAKALPQYLARAEMGFWQEEVFVALYQAARLKEELGYPEQDVIDAYARASDALPLRAEALHGAAKFCRSKGRNEEGFQLAKRGVAIGKPNNGLFVESWIYDYGLLDELAINGYWSGHYHESADACVQILLGETIAEHERKRILANLRFALTKLPPPSEPNLGSRAKDDLLAQHAIGPARDLRSRLADPGTAPRVLVAILAKQKAKALPLYLECIEALDYPKSSVVLYIRTNNNTDQTKDILREWVDRIGHLYAGVEFDAEDVADRVEQFGVHEWNPTRFRVLGRIRNISLRRALEQDCDFYFVADVDNFVRPCTLRELVALNLPIAAPLLRSISPESFYSNYHAEIDANGYYKDCDQYQWVLNRWIVGVQEMPVVHCTYLIRADVLPDLTYEDATDRFEYVVFSDSARKNGVPQYLDNRQVYGYITFDEGDPHHVDNGLERARALLDANLGAASVAERFACRHSNSRAEPEARLREKFSEIYQKNEWGYGSGVGSLPVNNVSYMKFVQSFLQSCDIKSVVDFGCGDWQFTRFMDWSGTSYVGLDLVPSLIESNRKAFARPGLSFEVYRDIDELPTADLLLCKDVFQHLPNDTVGEYLAGFKRKFKFLLITNDDQPESLVNCDIEAGGWRPVRLDRPPFSERAPIILSWTIAWGGWKPTHKATSIINGIR